jgi:hypothetical protein
VFDWEHELVERFTFRNLKGVELCDAVTAIIIDLTFAKETAKKSIDEMSFVERWTVFLAFADKVKHGRVITEITKKNEVIAVANDTLLHISQALMNALVFVPVEYGCGIASTISRRARNKKLRKLARKYEPLLTSKDADIAVLRAQLNSKHGTKWI